MGPGNDSLDFELGFQTEEGRFLVGFSKFKFSYKQGEDHHVKNLELKLSPKLLDGGKRIHVDINGNMYDDTNHSAAEIAYCITLAAISKDAVLGEDTVNLLAMQSFQMRFDADHHVKEYSAKVKSDGGQDAAVIKDNSGHTGSGVTSGQILKAPKQILADMILEDVHFLNYFKMGMNGTDHHVAHTGITYEKGNAVYDLSDNGGNHVDYSDSHVDIWSNF